ncbi:MAG: DNA mismatch repair protein MutS, partial [Proteobacteria bacterium]|nr:DNA mismatch repair protein MutS [Pseudomonadota bacterium]
NVHVAAVEHGEKLVFLHSVRDGPANQSYGLQVASLAGIPPSVIRQARTYLAELERERDALRAHASPQGELPLFAPPEPAGHSRQPAASPGEGAQPPSAALDVLRAADLEDLSPRAALDLLFRLKELDSKDQAS